MLASGFFMGGPTTSAQFSETLLHITGDGVCQWGSRFAGELSGFSITLGSGYALAAGHWLQNDEPITLPIPASDSHADRVDIAAIQVDTGQKAVRVVVLSGVDWERLPEEPFTLPLYAVRVKRGASNLLAEDLVDLRRFVPTLAELSQDGERVYYYVTSGLDQKVARILGLGQALLDKGDRALASLDAAIRQKGARAVTGDLCTARFRPIPEDQWLLCNGTAVPEAYPALSALLQGKLPQITHADPRIFTYIFAGKPAEGGA